MCSVAARADVDAGNRERPVPPQAVQRGRRGRPAGGGQRLTPTGPMGQSELSMSMVCLARRPCGVLISMCTP